MIYVEYQISANTDVQDLLIADMADLGFESFVQEQLLLKAYIQKKLLKEFETAQLLYEHGVSCKITEIQPQNWNKVWENDFQPVLIENKVFIRASFHEPNSKYIEIIINPKMSFGTGHHPTTALMVQLMLNHNLSNKTVVDVGTGTGILAILAEKLGALSCIGFDNHQWAFDNAQENAQLNNCLNTQFLFGTIANIKLPKANLIFANINKNAILSDINAYASISEKNTTLMVSGFLNSDKEEIIQAAIKNNFTFVKEATNNEWVAIQFTKL